MTSGQRQSIKPPHAFLFLGLRSKGALFSLCLLLTAWVQAAPLSPSDRNSIELQQQDILRQNQLQREALERSQTVRPSLPSAGVVNQGPCFTLNTIVFEEADHLSRYRQRQLTADFVAKCLNLSQINQLIKNVSDDYIQRGYITSRAFLTEQDLSQGTLTIVVLEGKLEDITLEGKSPLSLAMAFPHLKGKILNLRDIEQGMEQINRVRSTPVQIDILPGKQPGYSIINLTATPEFPLQFGVGFDNSGQKNTGVGQLNASLTANNLLGLADRWFVSGARSSAFANDHDAQSVQAGVSIPYGYGLLDYNYAYSNYLTTINNRGYDWRSRGDTQTHRVTGSWTVYRDSDMKTALMLGLTRRSSQNYLNDERLDSSSRVLTSAMLGINQSFRLWRGFATFNPTFNRGIPWLGGEHDTDKAPHSPQAEFTKWTLSSSYYLPLTESITYLTSAYGQWTPDRLYGSERLTIGGESSVRGFKEQYLAGDKGGYWRNELDWTLFSWPLLGNVGAVAAIDGGYLQPDSRDPYASGTLWGGAVGLFSAGRVVSNQLTVGWPLSYPGWLTPDRVSVYYRIGLAF